MGDEVWLDKKNLKTQYPSAKLAPKRLGPYKILEKVGSTSYRLDIPDSWKIHDVFHGSLLKTYVENEEHGPNYTRPDAELVDEEEEYEVEVIIDSKIDHRFRREEQLQYLVKWKGYPDSDNQWIPFQNLTHAPEIIKEFH